MNISQLLNRLKRDEQQAQRAYDNARKSLDELVSSGDLRIVGFRYEANPKRPSRRHDKIGLSVLDAADKLRSHIIELRKCRDELCRCRRIVEKGIAGAQAARENVEVEVEHVTQAIERFRTQRTLEISAPAPENTDMAKKKTSKKKTTKKASGEGRRGRQPSYTFSSRAEYEKALESATDPVEKRKIRAAGRRHGYSGGLGATSEGGGGRKKTAKKKSTKKKAAKKKGKKRTSKKDGEAGDE